ncbi:MAG: nucleoside 2-deoxyribosyltransferase [Negativicutes bacterium]|nr:nucleoside 2-deoxyribosyltransferase [Negativicutes bacterium]
MSSKKFVYLAGPILDCGKHEANNWRRDVDKQLSLYSGSAVAGISPLRCEPLVGDTYGLSHEDKKFGTARAIQAKNFFDVNTCDLVLAYLPTPPEGRHQSYGTICEIAWAHALGKPVILVSDDPGIVNHPVINASCNWVLDSLDEAVDVCVGILSGYSGGKRI